MNVSKTTAAFPPREDSTLPLPVSPWIIETVAHRLKPEEPAADSRQAGRLNDKKAEAGTGQLTSPDSSRTQLPSSPTAAAPSAPHSPTAPTNTPKTPAPCLTSCSPGREARLCEKDGEEAGREGGSGPAPLGSHHLHWPHHFSAGRAAHSSNGWQFQFVTFLCYNF